MRIVPFVASLLAVVAFGAPESVKRSTTPDDEQTADSAAPKQKTSANASTAKKSTPQSASRKSQKTGTAGMGARSESTETEKSAATPKPKSEGTSTTGRKRGSGKETTAAEESGESGTAAKPKSAPKPGTSEATAKTTAAVDPAAPPPEQVPPAANASISSGDLVEFASQPPRVQKLIESALALTRRDLTYIYGSADPASGGMDCSGFVYYVLRENGFADVPRAANEQYVWVRKADEFDAVLSKKKQTFELDALKPGDLLFWTGTYSTERDPPVTHSMIYLGTEKGNKQRVMAGSSDGRTYRGKSRWGVSVFDFQGGQTSRDPSKAGRGGFVGYATIPGIRDEAAESAKLKGR